MEQPLAVTALATRRPCSSSCCCSHAAAALFQSAPSCAHACIPSIRHSNQHAHAPCTRFGHAAVAPSAVRRGTALAVVTAPCASSSFTA